jgi:uncharacterized membrane protein
VLGYDWPHLHAALNDIPAAVLLISVLFDWAAAITKRESLRAAALWTLWAGVIGGWAAVVAGMQAEEVIDHGPAIHELMDDHETLALITMGAFTVVLVYKLFRRARLSRVEELALRGLSLAGLGVLLWTARIGGNMYFEHAAGVPTAVFGPETQNRALNHEQHPHAGSHEH